MEPASPSSSTPQPAPARRRGCLGCLFHGGMGCAAFLVGSVAAAALFAPSLLGGPMAELLEDSISGRIAGRISVDDLQLSWTRRQRAGHVELLDPDGKRVAAMELTLPSLLTLLGLKDEHWEVRARVKTADVRVDADGGTNLARALDVPRSGSRGWVRIEEFDSRLGYAQVFPYTVHLTGDAIRLFGLAEETVEVNNLSVVFDHEPGPGQDDSLAFSGAVVHAGQEGSLSGNFSFAHHDLEPVFGTPWRNARSLSLNGTLVGLPTAALSPLLAGTPFEPLLGPALTGEVVVARSEVGDHEVSIRLQEDDLGFDAVWENGVLRGTGEELAIELPLPAGWLEDRLAAHLPEGTRLARPGGSDEPWRLAATGLSLPIGAVGEPWPGPEELLAGTSGVFVLEGPGRIQLVPEDQLERALIDLDRPVLTVALTAGAAPRLDLVAGPVDARTVVAIRGEGDLDRSWRERDVSIDVDAPRAGVELLDYLRGDDGLLPALFGPRTTVHYARPRGGPASLRLQDEDGSLLAGVLETGALVGGPGEGARLVLDLTAEPAAELVRTFLPWMEELARDPSAQPVTLTLERYRLPLSGDLRTAQATMRLSLGTVRYRLHPGMHGVFEPDAAPVEIEVFRFPTVRMSLEREIVRFDELVIAPGADDQYDFTGELDLRDGKIELLCDAMPLRHVTSMVLPGAEDTEVPATLLGPWDEPRINMDREVIDGLTTGLNALMEGLRRDDG